MCQPGLEKLDKGEYDALILAAAGLRRLGLEERIFRCFEPEEMLPGRRSGNAGGDRCGKRKTGS